MPALLSVLDRYQTDAYFLLSLTEDFCRAGRIQALVDLTLTRQVTLPTPEPYNDWLNSALLPFLVLSGDDLGVQNALSNLEHASKGWRLSGPLAWLACHSAQHFFNLRTAHDRIFTWMRLQELDAQNPWGRTACHETLNATLFLLNHREQLSSDLSEELPNFALRLYGVLPEFWDMREHLRAPSPALQQAHKDFEHIQAVVHGRSTAQASAAIARMAEANVHGLKRFCLELGHFGFCSPSFQNEISKRNRYSPRKIWPATHDTETHSLTLISGHKHLEVAQTAPIAVISVVCNERPLLPAFLAHYRRLGVEAFLIADNDSDDGSAEWLAAQPDVILFSASGSFREAQQGTEWKQALMAQFRPNRWSVIADADEFLVAPTLRGPGHPQGWDGGQDLPTLLRQAQSQGWDALSVLMLDLYPKEALAQAEVPAQDPFDVIGYADRAPFVHQCLDRGPFGTRTALRSGVRHRLLPGSAPNMFVSEKVALLRYRPWMRLSVSLHYATGVNLAPDPLIFGHFKYTAQFHDKVIRAIEGGQFFDNSAEYHRYAQMLEETGGQIFDPATSVPWQDAMRKALQDSA
jgi:hypothetical protein